MADTLYAYTKCVYGKPATEDGPGGVVEFDPGTVISNEVPKEVIADWIASGAVTKYNRLEVEAAGGSAEAMATVNAQTQAELDAANEEIAALKAQLAEATKPAPTK